MSERLEVRKTYKLFIGGGFPRSESGRTMPVTAADGRLLAHVARASRKDVRDAVRAARAAQPGGPAARPTTAGRSSTASPRSWRAARASLAGELEAVGVAADEARADVESAIDAAVYWAGFADKLDQLVGAVNPVSGPFLNLSNAIPLGVCALACPDDGGVRRRARPGGAGDHGRKRGRRAGRRPRRAGHEHAGRGGRHLRRAGRGGEPADGRRPGPAALAGGPRRRGPDRPERRPRGHGGRSRGPRGRQPQAHRAHARGRGHPHGAWRSARSARSGTPRVSQPRDPGGR